MPLDIRIRFGHAIRRIRQEQELNQEDAAERCGLHRTYYSGIERGVRNVSFAEYRKGLAGLKNELTGTVQTHLMYSPNWLNEVAATN